MNNEEIQYYEMVEKVLRTLPNKFNAVVITIEDSKDLTQILVDELGSLLSHESMMNRYDNSLENAFISQVLISKGRRGSKSRGRGRSNRSSNERDNE
jgi:hypothetical protein